MLLESFNMAPSLRNLSTKYLCLLTLLLSLPLAVRADEMKNSIEDNSSGRSLLLHYRASTRKLECLRAKPTDYVTSLRSLHTEIRSGTVGSVGGGDRTAGTESSNAFAIQTQLAQVQ